MHRRHLWLVFGGVLVLASTSVPVRAWVGLPMCIAELSALPQQSVYETALEQRLPKQMCGPASTFAPVLGPQTLSGRAVDAYKRGVALMELGAYAEARLQLDLARRGLPRVRDHIALKQAELAMLRRRQPRATALFNQALDTVSDDVRFRARTGYVEALLEANDPRTVPALEQLLWDYPDHPREAELLLQTARSLERVGKTDEAGVFYRSIVVGLPESPLVALAAEHLVNADPGSASLSDDEQVRRARRLVQRGPLDEAKHAVDALLKRVTNLSDENHMHVHWLAARLARHSGNWGVAHKHMELALKTPPASEGLKRRLKERASDMREALLARDPRSAEKTFLRLKRNKPIHRVAAKDIAKMVHVAARAGLKKRTEAALRGLVRARRSSTTTLLAAAVTAIDLADEALVSQVLKRAWNIGSTRQRPAASYHLARLQERGGKPQAAVALYRRAIAESAAIDERYYGMWSDIGLRRLDGDRRISRREGFLDVAGPRIPSAPKPQVDALAQRLAEIGINYQRVYPWFGRAEDLFRMGEVDAAQSEIFRGYIAYRQSAGRHIARAGLDSVARGADRTRRQISRELRDARSKLTGEERATLSNVAKSIGDWGTAGGFSGSALIQTRPRAYEWHVVRASNRYGLDPNLLLAVMRVESVYQKRIVSYAGAIGLLQIMPRTGRLIAQSIGRDDFTPSDLLNPATNIEFAAWYLASLIRRFDGHLPLAIAAYNGGPHNVRRWMRDHHDKLSLDALLERIPFEQTHRYVRRVLVHYEAYRAQQGLPMQLLSTVLPPARIDPLAF